MHNNIYKCVYLEPVSKVNIARNLLAFGIFITNEDD